MKLKDAEKRLKNEPNNLGLRVQVAGLMREAGRSIEAVELYRSVALAYRDQGRTQQAIAVCKSILEIAPEDSACQGLLSLLQAKAAMPSQPAIQRPSRPSRPPATEAPKRPPPSDTAKPPPQAVIMRGSPMPPAPEVPSLRPATSPPANRPQSTTAAPGGKPIAVGQRPLTPTRPPSRGMESVEEPTRARSPTKPQVPMPARPTEPARPVSDVAKTQQVATRSPVQQDPRQSDPARRSSFDQTPLPPPMPYHQADRTSQPTKVSAREIDDDTRPDQQPSGLADAARRISNLINERGVPKEMDVSAELDTRQRPKIPTDELDKIAAPPPTLPIDKLDEIIDDLTTPPPGDYDTTSRQRALTPTPRGSDDAITQPPSRTSTPSNPTITSISERNLPRVGPPQRTSSRPPAVVSIPPKRPTPSVPPISIPSKRPTPSVPPIVSTPVGKLRPPPAPTSPPPRPGMSKIPRESDEELTRPRDRGALDDDED